MPISSALMRRYPLNADRSYTAPEAPLEAYERLMAGLGIGRVVIVHGSAHGPDMSVTLDALAALGPRGRGVAVVAADVEDGVLRRMDQAGIRGIRLTTLLRGGVRMDDIAAMARRVAPLGWHVQVFVDGPSQMEDIAPRLRGLGVPIVIDHMGRFRAPDTVDHPGFGALLQLVEEEDCWVKLSAPSRCREHSELTGLCTI